MADYKTTWREKIGYGVGAIGLDLSYGLFTRIFPTTCPAYLGLKKPFC